MGVNKSTASYYFHRLRLLIYSNSEHLELLEGEVEADESYFGGVRKGKRGRGASGKVPVFGLLKRQGKVFTVIIPNAKTDTLRLCNFLSVNSVTLDRIFLFEDDITLVSGLPVFGDFHQHG